MGKILDKICDYLKQYLKKYNDKKTSKVSYLIRVSLNQAVEIIGKERIYFCWNYENEDLENRLKQIAFDFKLNKTNNILNCSDKIIDELRNKNIITIKNRKYDNEDFSEVSKFIKDIKEYFHQNLKENIINNEYSKKMIDINTAEEVIKIREDIAKIDNKSNKENKQSKELIKSIGVLSIGEPICKKDIINDCEYKWDLTEFFDRKLYKKGVTWVNIQNKLDEYIKEINKSEEYSIRLASSFSIAYYIGMRVNPKVGMQKIRIFQLDRELGLKEWTYKQDLRNEEYEAFELYTESKDINTTDIAICISATHDIFEDVKEYLIKDDIKVNKIINFHLKSKYVINGNHACNLVSQISETISKERFVNIHIFVSAPISMMYMLGKNSFDVKNINLYEHFGESSYKKVAFIQKGDAI